MREVLGTATGTIGKSIGVGNAKAVTCGGTVTELRAPYAFGGHSPNWRASGLFAVHGKHYFETVTICTGMSVYI